ncbi:MAG: pirin family protein, partial [Rhodococcus sp.]|nr:pirin family protein [Rhodococcus sp. (in: high G+C Gram-positive bacteria)]
ILHSEKNDSWRLDGATGIHADEHANPVRFVQMWVMPDEAGITPGYEQLEIDDELMRGGLVPVASGLAKDRDHAAIRIHNKYAGLSVARLQPGAAVTLPDAPFLHVFIAEGTADLEGAGTLTEGDAVRLTHAGGQRLSSVSGAEVLVWEMHATIGR